MAKFSRGHGGTFINISIVQKMPKAEVVNG